MLCAARSRAKPKKRSEMGTRDLFPELSRGQLSIRAGDFKFIRISSILETIQPAFFLILMIKVAFMFINHKSREMC